MRLPRATVAAAAIATTTSAFLARPPLAFFVSQGRSCLSPSLGRSGAPPPTLGRSSMSSTPVGAHHHEDALAQQPPDDAFSSPPSPIPLDEKDAKKLRKEAAKEAKREKRQGSGLTLKPCDLCLKNKDLLIRCQIDTTLAWKMVCGKCWKDVSGGVVDGDAAHPHYRYGGLWKAR